MAGEAGLDQIRNLNGRVELFVGIKKMLSLILMIFLSHSQNKCSALPLHPRNQIRQTDPEFSRLNHKTSCCKLKSRNKGKLCKRVSSWQEKQRKEESLPSS